MRIGCLQFAPYFGDVNKNLDRADGILSRVDLNVSDKLDLLVLPEMAFTGSNPGSTEDIYPHVEPSASGITSLWARTAALKYDCSVLAGYPEKALMETTGAGFYSSFILVNPDGETIANCNGKLTEEEHSVRCSHCTVPHLGSVSVGHCRDLGSSEFERPSITQNFARRVLEKRSRVAVLSTAWMTAEEPRDFSRRPNEPDMDSISCWVQRLEPIIRAESKDETIVVFCNRTGSEADATYAGTSAVLGIKGGEVLVYGILGRSKKDLLVVDTSNGPIAKLVYRPDSEGDSSSSVDRTSTEGAEAHLDEPTTPDTSDKASEPADGSLVEKHKGVLSMPKVNDYYPRYLPAVIKAGHAGMGLPTRPRIIIPSSNLQPPQEALFNSPGISASSNATVRPLKTSAAQSTSNAPWIDPLTPRQAHPVPNPARAEVPATPITAFEDLTPMSEACAWPSSRAADGSSLDDDRWSMATGPRQGHWPARWKYPRTASKSGKRAGRTTYGASTRPDTPAVAQSRFNWPKPSQTAKGCNPSRLGHTTEQKKPIPERPDSPKSRNVRCSDLRQDEVKSMRKPQSCEDGERSVTVHSIAPEKKSGAITTRPSPSIFSSDVLEDRFRTGLSANKRATSAARASQTRESRKSGRVPAPGSARASRSLSPETRLRGEFRGRRRERADMSDSVNRISRREAMKNGNVQRPTQEVPRKAHGSLRRIQSQQILHSTLDEQQRRERSVVQPKELSQTGSRTGSTEHGQPSRRQRSSSQGVLPGYGLANAGRGEIASWPISSEDLRLSASIIHKRLIDSFAR